MASLSGSHVITVLGFGNQFALTTTCQEPCDHVITISLMTSLEGHWESWQGRLQANWLPANATCPG